MQALISAFVNDPELAHIPSSSLPYLRQAFFVCAGCDFVSFFNGLGKASFLATLFEYSKYICAKSEHIPGRGHAGCCLYGSKSLSLPTLEWQWMKQPDSATIVVDWDSDDHLSLVQVLR